MRRCTRSEVSGTSRLFGAAKLQSVAGADNPRYSAALYLRDTHLHSLKEREPSSQFRQILINFQQIFRYQTQQQICNKVVVIKDHTTLETRRYLARLSFKPVCTFSSSGDRKSPFSIDRDTSFIQQLVATV